jgi:hypothetical protein
MPEEKPTDDVEKFLQDQRSFEDRKQSLIDDLLRQRAEAMKAFDDKLAKLGHSAQTGRHKKSHHKAPAPDAPASPKGKTKG